MPIPFYRPSIGPKEIQEVVATLASGWLTTGPRTHQFEREFAADLKRKHAVAVNSCTAALHLALEAIGLKRAQAVVVPTMTFAATAEVVRYFSAMPILVDCRAEDFNLDVADAERRIHYALAGGLSVIAILPVHYGGQIGDVTGVQALAKRYQLKVIEDAAHCCPAYYRVPPATGNGINGVGTRAENAPPVAEPSCDLTSARPGAEGRAASGWLPVGSAADITCFSFYANKTITTGEGGMACTENDEYAERMRIMSLHGISRDAWKRFTADGSWFYEIIAPGYKYNMTDIAAAIGLQQLRRAEELHRQRTELARRYSALLREVDEVVLPTVQPDRIHSWHLYVIRLKLARLRIDRARFIRELKDRGVGSSVHWTPLHMHPYYRQTYGYAPEDFPVACSLYPEIITLPLYPGMTDDDVRYVADAIKEIVAHNLRLILPADPAVPVA